jgi:hypothetical protein
MVEFPDRERNDANRCFYDPPRVVDAASFEQVRQPICRNAVRIRLRV